MMGVVVTGRPVERAPGSYTQRKGTVVDTPKVIHTWKHMICLETVSGKSGNFKTAGWYKILHKSDFITA